MSATPRADQTRATVLGPMPGRRRSSQHGGAVLVRSSSRSGMVPVATRSTQCWRPCLCRCRDGEKLFGLVDEGGELGGLLLDGLGGAAVGADAEGIGGVDFEERGGLVEQAGEGDVVHGLRAWYKNAA